jgi:hypothetical protein
MVPHPAFAQTRAAATTIRSARYSLITLGLILVPGASTATADGRPVKVELRKTDHGWQLLRNGEPYFIRGAGGDGSKTLLVSLGANSFRTWGVDGLSQKLEEAQRAGLTVAVGIWLGHERHGFNYNDRAQVARQYEAVREAILRYKDHPAVLLWGLGNEMEGYGKADNTAVWSAVNDVGKLAKSLDPNHPTMTVMAEIGGDRVKNVHKLCPDIDIVGINSYGGAPSLPERYRKAGGTKPYILTEFGPNGPWESGKTPWGASLEPTSTEKAAAYRQSYEKGIAGAPGLCLGSYAFAWGHKRETTATWFGILLPEGSRLAAADELSMLWSGKAPKNRCPKIESLKLDGPATVAAGELVRPKLAAADPDGDPMRVRWVLQADSTPQTIGGDHENAPPTFPKAILASTAEAAEVRIPADGGRYRIFAYVSDDHGGAAVANIPLNATR